MVLELPGKLIKGQKDVRETVQVDPIVAGEGINVAVTEGVALISGEDSGVANKGIVIVSPGEGIDVSYASGNATVSGEDSAVGNKGIIIVAGGEGMDVSYSAGTATVSGEDATVSNKGIASFNTNDFSVATGAVSLKNKTSYWSAPGNAFLPVTDTDQYTRSDAGIEADAGTITFFCPVHLPHGAVVTGAIVYSGTATTWELRRLNSAQSEDQMATANMDAEDTSISNATIDNENYSYFLKTGAVGDNVIFARITYTTDYD